MNFIEIYLTQNTFSFCPLEVLGIKWVLKNFLCNKKKNDDCSKEQNSCQQNRERISVCHSRPTILTKGKSLPWHFIISNSNVFRCFQSKSLFSCTSPEKHISGAAASDNISPGPHACNNHMLFGFAKVRCLCWIKTRMWQKKETHTLSELEDQVYVVTNKRNWEWWLLSNKEVDNVHLLHPKSEAQSSFFKWKRKWKNKGLKNHCTDCQSFYLYVNVSKAHLCIKQLPEKSQGPRKKTIKGLSFNYEKHFLINPPPKKKTTLNQTRNQHTKPRNLADKKQKLQLLEQRQHECGSAWSWSGSIVGM